MYAKVLSACPTQAVYNELQPRWLLAAICHSLRRRRIGIAADASDVRSKPVAANYNRSHIAPTVATRVCAGNTLRSATCIIISIKLSSKIVRLYMANGACNCLPLASK